MVKRFILFLLLCSMLAFSSCSSMKSFFNFKKDDVILPENQQKEQQKEQRVQYRQLVKAHNERQAVSTKEEMKANKKRSKQYNKKMLTGRRCSWLPFRKKSCNDVKKKDPMLMDGIRDER